MKLVESALENHAREYKFTPSSLRKDAEKFLKEYKRKIVKALKVQLNRRHTMKFQLSLQCRLQKEREGVAGDVTLLPWFPSKSVALYNAATLSKSVDKCHREILGLYDAFIQGGSGWVLQSITCLVLRVARTRPLKGGCTSTHPLPAYIRRKHACKTIECHDNKCFLYSVVASLYFGGNRRRVSSSLVYSKYISLLNTKGIDCPIYLGQISRFEKQNKQVSINVYGTGEKINTVYPLRVTKHKARSHHINLLYYKGHYHLITQFERLLGRQIGRWKHKRHFCFYCLASYLEKSTLKRHMQECVKRKPSCQTPPPGTKLKFTNYSRAFKADFVIYYDFESLCVPLPEGQQAGKKSVRETMHVPISFGAIRVSSCSKHTSKLAVYRGLDCIERFWDYLQEQSVQILNIRAGEQHKIVWNEAACQRFQDAKCCQICGVCFEEQGVKKCADHLHICPAGACCQTNFRGALCNTCNWKFGATPATIPVVSHNFVSYDGHHVISALHKFNNPRTKVIPRNTEKYLAMKVQNFWFIDSLEFLNASLDVLSKNLTEKGREYFTHTNALLANCTPEQDQLCRRKGIFCYDYATSPERLAETSLPPKAAFYNSLKGEHVTDVDYKRALDTWDAFECKSLGEYMDLYLRLDVVLLADVFESFRALSLSFYGLDPLNYFSLPGLAWDAALKLTGAELDLLHDISMYEFLEKGIRGGICQINVKYFHANIPGTARYDPVQPPSWILDLDANGLYSKAMTQPLPYKDFRWLSDAEIKALDISSIPKAGDLGYIFQVDLNYPPSLHDEHNDLPLCPLKRVISRDELSETAQMLAEHTGVGLQKVEKLILDFHNKSAYVIHFRNLQFCLKAGLQITRIHKVLCFTQKAWLQPFVYFNTDKRKKAKDVFTQNLFKLILNSIYGKSLQSSKNKIDYSLVTDKAKFLKLSNSSQFHSFNIFNESLVGVRTKRAAILLDKPIFVGFTVLELSKLHMFKFHYNVIRKYYGNHAQILCMDTDGIMYAFRNVNPTIFIHNNPKYFDTSNYPEERPLHSVDNKRVPGCFKNEFPSKRIVEFCGLRSKMYSVRFLDDSSQKRAKGVPRRVLATINHEEYLLCLSNMCVLEHSFRAIRSQKHQLYTMRHVKSCLSPFDDKRFLLPGCTNTLAYGHFRVT